MLTNLTRFASSAALMAALVAPMHTLAQATTPLHLAYNPSNTSIIYTSPVGVTVSKDGQRLLVTTAPVAGNQGGRLTFGTYPWWITVADFSAGNKVGYAHNGDRYRGTGALVAPKGQLYVIGTLVPDTSNVFAVTSVPIAGPIRGIPGNFEGLMTGTITTDGSTGKIKAANIINFDLHIDGTQPAALP